ncbi:hypothetical protein QWZ03_06615 [Chitinimonas viridis]|uniref:Imm33-like domain-containing protein n=1 Tax=Chitinimonas viridis TaxID=664880 RepID=A0ABT8B4K9_9NEIS|nr:hypothetical protein [Chitinimonas viridis]MDN3576434.1 hypothetical protein [Chitinimonas viridis]
MSDMEKNAQRVLCEKYEAPFWACDAELKVGVARNVVSGLRPINGLRIRPEGGACGWYIWAGEEWSDDPDFFLPLHVKHLEDWVPLALRYLGLPPGWRFLITESYEDVWEDKQLLENVE